MSEKFCLKWNDFHSNVSKSFTLFRNEEYLHDVTLVSDDHSKVSAHKLVLSACSDYFRDIFMNNQHSNPLICLDGISSADLNNIMDYIYNGEVYVFQENIDSFLAVAQKLKLEGLNATDNKYEEVEEYEDNMRNIDEFKLEDTVPVVYDPNKKNKMIKKVQHNKVQDKVSNVVAVKSQDLNEINEKINAYIEESFDGSYRCTLCGKTSGLNMTKSIQRQTIQRHIETHLDGLSYTCPICQKIFRSRPSLNTHRSSQHKHK